MDDNCGRCGQPEDEHTPGQRCPVDTAKLADSVVEHMRPLMVSEGGREAMSPNEVIPLARGICQICKYEGFWEHIQTTLCPHKAGPGTFANSIHLNPANRRRGRPPGAKSGSGYEAAQRRQQQKINVHTRRLVVEKIVGAGIAQLDETMAVRLPKRPNLPDRNISDLKDAALKLLNQQMWNLEGVAENQGLTPDEEARLLKLLAGFNAALPKAVEKPADKPISEMTDDELDALEKSK